MTKKQKPLSGLAKYVYDNEFHIRAGLKSAYEGNTFDYRRIREREKTVKDRACRHAPAPDHAFHDDWNSIDDHRRSFACVFEQVRARIWALGEVLGRLPEEYSDLYHLTFANTKDRRLQGDLFTFNPNTYRRKFRETFARLKGEHPHIWGIGVVEISAVQIESGQHVFEPHFHVLVGGVPANALRVAFDKLLPSATKGSHGLMIRSVSDRTDLGRRVSYLFKFEPELRTKFHTSEGRVGKGRLNRLSGNAKDEWLSWAAAYRIDELLITVGLWPDLMTEFKSCGLQQLIAKLPTGGLRDGQ